MMKQKNCSICGAAFSCGSGESDGKCWCNDFPKIMPLDFSQDCRCPKCLKEVVKEKIDDFVKESPPQGIASTISEKYAGDKELIEDIDYVIENGQWVFTEWYHLKRGYCCKNGCRNCPYEFKK